MVRMQLITRRTVASVACGILLILFATVLEVMLHSLPLWPGVLIVQTTTPLLWIIDTAPLVLVLWSAPVVTSPRQSQRRWYRFILFLLITVTVIPFLLLILAVWAGVVANDDLADINRASSLRYRTMLVAQLARNGDPTWSDELEEMTTTRTELARNYAAQVAATDAAWATWTSQLAEEGTASVEVTQELVTTYSALIGQIRVQGQQVSQRTMLLLTAGIVHLVVTLFVSINVLGQWREAEVQLRDSEVRFKQLVAASMEGLVISEGGRIVDLNDAAASLFGYDPSDMIGMSVGELVVSEDRDMVRQKVSQQIELEVRARCLRSDGSVMVCEVSGRMVPYYGRTARVSSLRDITERKIQDAVLVTQRRQLEVANTNLSVLVRTDALTDLNNRRAFDEFLETEQQRAVRYNHPVGLLLLDVDHFKDFNDTYGHPAGDRVLQQLGALLQQTARETDLVARYGGEEFAVVLPETDIPDAYLIAERMRYVVATAEWSHRPITVSVGVAATRPGENAGENLLGMADQALYKAKVTGRNRVVTFADDDDVRVTGALTP